MIGDVVRFLFREVVCGLELAFAAHREARLLTHGVTRLPARAQAPHLAWALR
jgi:hypothetical protein